MHANEVKVGDVVTFVDLDGVEHSAIVEAVHGPGHPSSSPSVNLKLTGNASVVKTSVVHQDNHNKKDLGEYWKVRVPGSAGR